MKNIIEAEWPAPKHIRAFTTTKLTENLALPNEPIYLTQIHSNIVVPATNENRLHEADASFTKETNQICVVRTADCLPILVTDKKGAQIAAIHAGWRGLLHGVIENTIKQFNTEKNDIMAWIGPAISAKHYEITNEMKEQFIAIDPEAKDAFTPTRANHCHADLIKIAKIRLNKVNVTHIFGGNYCTFSDNNLFYSYRRDNKNTGRLLSLIWKENEGI